MTTITIYGASDDLIEVTGCWGADEFNVAGHSGHVMWRGDFTAPNFNTAEQLRVYAIYDGCWHFSVGQVYETVPMAAWPVEFRQGTIHEAEYSVVLTIEAPEGTRLVARPAQRSRT